ncbi:hypothetical protein MKW94_027783 [Papaver nudicaule]|uniref:Protein PAIR1 n=1 Tax=Papaver nudicaule TaxID=74823 RepID=A0AA41UX98_PAPNU|nr:hypothetical protein [Papaver nudicaule]
MKLTINKACNLNSISVLPPHSRRPNGIGTGSDSSRRPNGIGIGTGSDSSVYGRASQLRSQGMSSQLSQLMSSSQNSMDNNIINNEQSQRFGSQERDNSSKRISCLGPNSSYAREETQMSSLRSPNNYKPRWGCAAPPPVTDRQKCQVSEELEHKIGHIETMQNRQGMVLESIQGDVMQVKKQMQEFALDLEGIKQKLAGHGNSLELVLKGEEDIKATLVESLKSLPNQLREEVHLEIASAISALQNQNEEQMLRLTAELSGVITNSVKAITSSLQPSDNNESVPSMLKLKDRDCQASQSLNMDPATTNSLQPSDNNESVPSMLKLKERDRHIIQSQNMERAMNSAILPQGVYTYNTRSKCKPDVRVETQQPVKQKPDSDANTRSKRKPRKKAETRQSSKQKPDSFANTKSKRKPEKKAGTRQLSKQEPDSFANTRRSKMNIPEEISLIDLDEEWRENNEWDEEFDGGFAYLLGEKETGVGRRFFDDDQVEAEQILKKARRNRKDSNVIVIN